jgi:TolB-like protein/Tfp pilus assembly protein PilF
MACLLRGGLGSEKEVAQDANPNAFEVGGVRFGSYEIDLREDGSLFELGRGAMGVTYRATDTSLQRKVALKIIKTDIAERSADARERFMREARAAAALRHENIATIHQFGMRLETGQYFYAMELIEGETLEDRVRRTGPLDARTTIEIAQQVTSALAGAEKHGLVHRDLKPANLMLVSPDGQTSNNKKLLVKIIDFGLAKAIHTPTDPQSLTHDRFVGTPAFASPEQFEHAALDVRSDIYSLGETLWFALTGKTPFAGRSVEEIHNAQQSNVLPVEQLKAAHVASRLTSLLKSMLAFEPASRPGTEELAAQLQRCSPEVRSVRRTRFGLAATSLMVLGLSAATMFLWVRIQNSIPKLGAPEKSVAVLPFENLNDDPENAHFADGIQDDVLTNIAKIGELKVISRSSVMQYRGQPRNLREIGKALGVSNVLEGTVRRAGNKLRVNVQLIDANTDKHIWANDYDRDVTDVFAIQSDLAHKIAEALQAKLSPEEKSRLTRPPTENGEAYLAFIQANNLARAHEDLAKLRQSELLYQRAVDLDRNFALAIARYSALQSWMLRTPDASSEHHEQAHSLAERALQLQPDLPEAHLALGFSYYYGDNNYDAALKEFEIAQRGLRNESEVYVAVGGIQRRQGKWPESTANFEKAVGLNPKDTWPLQNLAMNYQLLRNFDAANRTVDRALQINPQAIAIWELKAKLALGEKGDFGVFDQALEKVKSFPLSNEERLVIIGGEANFLLLQRKYKQLLQLGEQFRDDLFAAVPGSLAQKYFSIGVAQKALGDDAAAGTAFFKAKDLLEEQVKQRPHDPDLHVRLAKILAWLGEKDAAIADAQRAMDLRPESKDAFEGPVTTEQAAQVYAILGDKARAIELLDGLLSRPSEVTLQTLKVNPAWDPLRSDPAFQKLCEDKLDKRIAVLPFENLSDPHDEYFSDGLSEELISALAQISELKVIGRSSSFRFKDKKEEPKSIGEKLGVSTFLEGTVRKQRNRVRIVAALTNAADGVELWTRTFDRELKDIFAVQEEIARAVADSLKVTLLGTDSRSAQASATGNAEVHNAYLQGHFYRLRLNLEDLRKAIDYYDQAIQLDSNYALAYAERAEALVFMGDLTGQRPTAYPKARADAEKAVAIAPALAEARAALGFVLCLAEWKFAEGLAELKRAKELSPANPTANDLLARIIVYLGRFEEAERQARYSVELDPLSFVTQGILARVLFYAGKLEEADAVARKAAQLQPTGAASHRFQVLIAAQSGHGEAALREAQLEPDPGFRRFELAVAHYVRGDQAAADAALADLIANAREGFAYQIAEVYALRGEKDKAFEWLQTAFDDRDAGMPGLLVDPLLRGLRDDVRYKNLLVKVGLPESL